VEPVAIRQLKITPSWRDCGINEEHVQRLADLGGRWPPILVDRADYHVIDGLHRVAAAQRLGFECIDASMFEGDSDEALIEFVRRNVRHGLPLTLRERKWAAQRVLGHHPEWSDRRIAELCAISPKTVGRLRLTPIASPTEEMSQLDTQTRIGRDNKIRPVGSGSARARVLEALEKEPNASHRSVARMVGVSPETVRLVRMHLADPAPIEALPVPEPLPRRWDLDLALVSQDEGGDFVTWFDRTAVNDDECARWEVSIPLSRVYEIADEARRRSEIWMEFARRVEARARRCR